MSNTNPWFIYLMIAFAIVAGSMVLIILMQRPHGGGLAAAFGGAGAGGGDSVFGGRVGDALTWATVVAFVLFLGLGLGLNLISPSKAAVPRGACCFAEGTCSDLTEEDCVDGGGNWQGEGTNCQTTDCPLPTPSMEAAPPDDETEAAPGSESTPGTTPGDDSAPADDPDTDEPAGGNPLE